MTPRFKVGLTLVEMLVAMTASLVLLGAVVTVFQILGDAVGKSRRVGRLETDLCGIRIRLQQDLAGTTANKDVNGLLVSVDSGSVSGYFEVIEGPNSDLLDYSAAPAYDRSTNVGGNRVVGDTDDWLFFTTRNVTLDPFVGKFGSTTISADQAEVAWFCRPIPNTANPTLYTLYRRQLLIIGGYPRSPFASDGSMTFASWPGFYSIYDVSARREEISGGAMKLFLNTANDLQRRRNRFAHDPASNGSPNNLSPLQPDYDVLVLAGDRKGEDVIATNVLAFDVRLLDLQAMERQTATTVRMQPGDLSYWTTDTSLTPTSPVYTDLGFNAFAAFHSAATAPGSFGGFGPTGHSLAGSATTARTYDTWTSFYATNDQDDDGRGDPPIDDPLEEPPYTMQLGAIQITVRLYDVETRAIRQATITQSLKQ